MRVALTAALALLAAPAVALGPSYVTTLEEAPERVSLGFYATTCPEAVRAECGFVGFACTAESVVASVEGLASAELGDWLRRGLTAMLRSDADTVDLTGTAMSLTDANGWQVRFPFDDGLDWLAKAAPRGDFEVDEFHGTTAVTLGPSDRARFVAFLAACARLRGGPR
ncbi:MAG: hypothetical protein U1E56_03120 [Bauldia sp.]